MVLGFASCPAIWSVCVNPILDPVEQGSLFEKTDARTETKKGGIPLL